MWRLQRTASSGRRRAASSVCLPCRPRPGGGRNTRAIFGERQVQHRLAAGSAWQDLDLVFCTEVGTPIDHSNLRRAFAKATKRAGIGHWHPHELRHSAASLLSAAGVPLEVIADLLGHDGTRMTGLVYRHAVMPSVAGAVQPMNALFGQA